MPETCSIHGGPAGKCNLRMALWLSLSLLVIVLDQVSKYWLVANLAAGSNIPVTSFFTVVHVYNTGAAFSFLAEHSGWQRWFFVGMAAVVCGWLLTLLYRHQQERLQPAAFALVIGGAIGNVVDRLTHGAVVDFLYFHVGRYGWPAFNLADSAITLGVVLMLWSQFRPQAKHPAHD